MRKVNTIILFVSLTFLVSNLIQAYGTTKDSSGDWRYSDVRLIDPIDAGAEFPDIIAVLCRQKLDTFQIRVDFLSLEIFQDFSITVYFDDRPGGNLISEAEAATGEFDWEYKISYHNLGRKLWIYDSSGSPMIQQLRVTRDFVQDYIVITTGIIDNAFEIRSSRILVILENPISFDVLDYTSPTRLSAAPPPPLQVEFLFWNIMDSSTPATILRSWAGAHSGPQSSRHGLAYLFSAVDRWNIPIAMCDFFDQNTIFALNYLQVKPTVEDLIMKTLLWNEFCHYSNGYAQTPDYPMLVNESLLDQSSMIKYLIERYHTDEEDHIMLGGDFSQSVLGDPIIIESFFSYLAAHPWIRIVQRQQNSFYDKYQISQVEGNQNEVPYTVSGQRITSGLTNLEIQLLIKSELAKLPPNHISRLAGEIYRNLLQSNNENILLAPGSYLSQVGHLIEAAYWVENPQVIHSCEKDIDWDGHVECIFSTIDIFMSFELEGGFLAFGFANNETGCHQFIGPTTQFDILRSDPSMLIAEKGIAGDSGQIIGAFADPSSNIQIYSGGASSGSITLTSLDGTTQKSFSIHDGKIQITITTNNSIERLVSKLPIVLDPWLIYADNPADIYWEQVTQSKWIWGVDDQISVSVGSNSQFLHSAFDATYDALNRQEDPNYDYTVGHLLPIPMAVVEFTLQPSSVIILDIDP